MRVKEWQSREEEVLPYLYWLLAIVPLFPLACDYIMNGGILFEWITRIRLMGENLFGLLPSQESYIISGINDNAFNSNLFFIGSGILYSISHNIVVTYRITMLTIQIAAFAGARLFFGELYGSEKRVAFMGTMLYITSPYRIFISYDKADMSMTLAWAIIPFYAWAVVNILRQKEGKWKYLFFSAIFLAAVYYAHYLVFTVALGVTFIFALFYKKWQLLLTMLLGVIISLPAMYPLLKYLMFGGYEAWELSCQSVMPKGYRLGSFFATYFFWENHPGLGLGMLISIGVAIWVGINGSRKESGSMKLFCAGMGCLFMLLASRSFPWEYVQRIGIPFLRFVGLWKETSVFLGGAYLFFDMLCAKAFVQLDDLEEKKTSDNYLAFAIRLIVLVICISISIYQCNMLTYTRLPMELG